MAAASVEFDRWRTLLNEHPIGNYLRKNIYTGTSRQQNKDTRNLICIQSSDLFIWHALEGCILHCNLKALASVDEDPLESESTTQKNVFGAAGVQACTFQRLVAGDVFSLEVESISINRSCSHILLWGARGIRVVELPRRWGKNAVFEGGKETVTCKTIKVDDRMLSRSSSLKVLQVSWHPGSKTNSHLAVLTSDNRFCVYNILNADHPISTVLINSSDMSLDSSPSKNFVGAALGEVAVAFDFGIPITVHRRQKVMLGATPGAGGRALPSLEVWPVYCVRGNGAVLLVYSHLSDLSQVNFPVQGPLAMYPPADDNYGTDACSILCLPTPVPVLIISTCEGRLHHCVQLPSTEEDSLQHSDTSTSLVSERSFCGGLWEPIQEPILYVIETAVLELCLSLPQIEDLPAEEDVFMCPVLLKKDGNSPDRYHCSHAAGVHSVALPWLTSVQQYFLDDEDFTLPEEKECVVEHVLCTKPLYSCPTSPVLGLDVVTDPLLGATLVMLSSDLEFTVLPIGLQYQVTSAGENGASASSRFESSMFQSETSSHESFKKQLEQILQRKSSVPILKSSANAELSQQDMFQLLSRVTSMLREEYIHKQDHARQELHTRISMLQQRKEHQFQDVKALLDSRTELRDNATAISEKLEKCKDDHESLLRRLECCLRKIQSRVPVLSEGERQEMKELNLIKSNLDLYKQNIDQVRVKQEYQEKQIHRTGAGHSPALHQKQLAQIKSILQDESSDIEELKKDVTRMNLGLN